MENMQLAHRIRAFRKLKGFTQNELSELMGISIAIIGSIERGTRKPDTKILKQIAGVLDVDVEELTAATKSKGAQ